MASAASTDAARASLRRRASSLALARIPNARTSGANVLPCPTSVTSTTTKVQNNSRSRSGNGCPLSVSSGTVKIAARLTTPRAPAQLRMTTSRPVSRSAVRSLSPLRWPAAVAAWSPSGSGTLPSRVCRDRGNDWVSSNHSGRTSRTAATVTTTAPTIVGVRLVNTNRLGSSRRYLMVQQRERRFGMFGFLKPSDRSSGLRSFGLSEADSAEACPVHVLCSNDSYASKQVKRSPFSAWKCLRRRSAAFTAASHAEGRWFETSRDHQQNRSSQHVFGVFDNRRAKRPRQRQDNIGRTTGHGRTDERINR